MAPVPISLLDLTSSSPDPDIPTFPTLDEQLREGLRDGQPLVIPGSTTEDEAFAYRRSISTMSLYSQRGLEIYEEITQLEEYYPFNAELEILKQYGLEISQRMFGLPTSSVPLTDAYLKSHDGPHERKHEQNGNGGSQGDHPGPAANGGVKKEKWGDECVGLNNNGVNGGLNGMKASTTQHGLAVELGSGSLEKTRHLLRSLSNLLKPSSDGVKAPFESIEYKALDLERDSLQTTLSKLVDQESEFVSTSSDGSPRVVASGLIASYDQGLAYLNSKTSLSNGLKSASNGNGSSPTTPTTKSLLWLGSSIGNFTRAGATSFLANIVSNVLQTGDTMLIGIDNCSDAEMIVTGYNDPKGVTSRFIMEGVDHAGRTLHGRVQGGGLNSDNFEYVTRWNQVLGRHEAYVRCKVDGLAIPMPAIRGTSAQTVYLEKDEMIHIEFSYKYTQAEARQVFNGAGLRLIQRWTDSRRLHSIYLLEKPAFFFPSLAASDEIALNQESRVNPYGLPSLAEWEQMWKCWDSVTLELIPRELLMTKPIALRHIILFYLGHIPAFLDIHLSKYLKEPATEPASFHDIFERGIDPNVADPTLITHSHSVVPTCAADWPKVEAIIAFGQRVRNRVRDIYHTRGDVKMTRRLARVLAMVFEHEAMHMETLIYIALQASSELKPIKGFAVPDFKSLARFWNSSVKSEGSARRSLIAYETTTLSVGHNDDDTRDDAIPFDEKHEFGWDVEHPQRQVEVGAFKISSTPVTNGEYKHFLSEIHDEKKRLNLVPASWSVVLGGEENYLVKTLYGEVKFEWATHWPVTASARQLEAFAKSRGGRLPTQDELLVFDRQNPVDSPASNIGFANLHPIPATVPIIQRDGKLGGGDGGGVWMWSSTTLEPHAGYSASTLYPGYSSDFHDGEHQIIVGACFVTPPRCARATFVNWYQGPYPYVLAGARIAYDI